MQTKFKNLSDEELIKKFLEGHTTFFNALIKRYRNQWHQIIFFVVKDRDLAEDLLQDAIIKIYNAFSENNYKEHQKFSSWAGRICKNLAIDYIRSKKFSVNNFENTIETKDFVVSTLESMICDEDQKMLRNAINLLPPNQREVIFLRYYENLSFKEIAQKSDVSINIALGRMRYALINLQKIIGKKNTIY